jgi:alpha-tubulin suppressor-like RCC1 family protein/endonuclease/exonuclease/phosphatase family metal-dependent hydrolase
VVAGAVSLALVGGLLIGLGHWGGSADQAARETSSTAHVCADALVLGVNGNGERPVKGRSYGRTVDTVVRRVVAKAKRSGRRVVTGDVPLQTSRPTAVLRTHHKAGSPTRAVLARHRVRVWRHPVHAGVKTALAQLDKATARCPERPVLFVGYAQGAAVVHRVLARVGAASRLSGLVGGVLISDPDRVGRSVAHPVLGSPAAPRHQAGLFPHVLSAQPDVPRSRGSFAVWPVCTAGDLVCDPTRVPLHTALARAAGYARSDALRVVSRAAWHQLALWPVPTPRQQVVTGMVGDPIRLQLRVARGTRGSITWTGASGLPSGLSLSATGLLSGTPTRSGTWTVSYRTSNTSPVTTGHTGSLVVRITPESASLSAGGQTTCLTRSDGTARCWGRNDYGQVGDGTTTLRDRPADVKGKGWASISTSGASTCGVKQNGTLWCWGLDDYGQLGIGPRSPVLKPRRIGASTKWASVSTAWTHSCAVKVSGTLWCWGQNLWGQLGIGKTSRQHAAPHRVGSASNWTSVSAAGWHSCAINVSGTAYCWGHNTFGEVGDGTIALRTVPTKVMGGQTWLQLSTAWAQTCGITQTGRLLCWGFNRQGQLGDGTLTNHADPRPVDSAQSWTSVTTGDGSTCAIAADGRLWCWGDNRYAQLGSAAGNTPVRVPTLVSRLATAVQFTSAGWLHTCAIPVGAAFTCWGNDEQGQLGDGGVQSVKGLGEVRPAAHQVDLRGSDLPSTSFVEHASARRIAAAALASRPAAGRRPLTDVQPGSAKRAAAISPFTMMSMNVLGSQHTAPRGDEPNMAPGRLRSEWASTYVGMRKATLVGLQESQPDQIVALDSATRHLYTFYPGNSRGYSGAPQSVMWKRSDWKLLWHSSISIPFPGGTRPQPIVELQQRATGATLYWINVHFYARAAHQRQRDKAMKILLQAIHQLKGDHLPILLTGDFNEIAPAFCSITGKTPLVAATGGSNSGTGGTGSRCHPPRGARIDWIFGSRGEFAHAVMDYSAQVRRTTDHHVLSAQFGTAAASR